MNRPIAQAAVSTTYFERSRVLHSDAECRFHDARGTTTISRIYQPVCVTTSVRNFTLMDVTLDADSGLIFQDGKVIPEASYFPREGTHERSNVVTLTDDEDTIIGYNNVHYAYQHWLTQCVPAIDWSLRQQRMRPARLLLPPLDPWQEEFLDLLGYAGVPRVILAPGTVYRIPRAEYSEFLNGSTSFFVCMSAYDTMRRLLDRLPPADRRHSMLFVPCSNPYYGSIANAAAVTEWLRQHDVLILDKAISTAERINLFRNAEVVIGPVGEDLADVVFCKPGTLMWEWMPEHHENASFNRLAQAAGVDYWGDVFESDARSTVALDWTVEESLFARRMAEISRRLALRSPGDPATARREVENATAGKPIDELVVAFESLGDNCEFGLVQRWAGAEPLGLLRFAGITLDRLLQGLKEEFSGVGTADTLEIYLAGEAPREYMVHETSLDIKYHTNITEAQIGPEELRQREARRLGFLRRKMLADLASGEKIWVWREMTAADAERLRPLVKLLRRFGPNTLLWVVAADEGHAPGTLERLDEGFLKGYVERLAAYADATDISPESWYVMLEKAYDQCHRQQAGTAEVSAPAQPLSAMEILAQSRAEPPAKPAGARRWFSRLRS
jgi:capsular polysaccharide biosynthesis protein